MLVGSVVGDPVGRLDGSPVGSPVGIESLRRYLGASSCDDSIFTTLTVFIVRESLFVPKNDRKNPRVASDSDKPWCSDSITTHIRTKNKLILIRIIIYDNYSRLRASVPLKGSREAQLKLHTFLITLRICRVPAFWKAQKIGVEQEELKNREIGVPCTRIQI